MQQSTDIIGPAAFGAAGAAGAALTQYGTSFLAVGLAIVGAVLAAAEVDPWRIRNAVSIVVFNTITGVLGGAVLAWALAHHGLIHHPAMLALTSFFVAFLGHDAVQGLRPAVIRAIARLLGAGDK